MGDGVTQAARDSDLINKVDHIRSLKEKFEDKPSVSLADMIIDNLLKLKDMRRGYHNSVSYVSLCDGLKKYGEYLNKSKKS